MTSKYYHPDTDFFRKFNIAPPEATAHGTEDDISEKLKSSKPTNWVLEGNKLTCDTEHGEVVNFLPPEYIMRGIDSNGLPLLEKIV